MKTLIRMTLVLFLTATGAGLKAQLKSDIGIRYSGSAFNLFQVEYRKPLNEHFSLRFALTKGELQHEGHSSRIIVDTDSLTVVRNVTEGIVYACDTRFGIERKLREGFFSVHSDAVVGYYNQFQSASNYFIVTDEYGASLSTRMYTGNVPSTYYEPPYGRGSRKSHYLSCGLAAGVSLDVPFYRFILGVNAQCTGTVNVPVKNEYHADPMNDFESEGTIQYRWYPSAGVALRYVLGSGK